MFLIDYIKYWFNWYKHYRWSKLYTTDIVKWEKVYREDFKRSVIVLKPAPLLGPISAFRALKQQAYWRQAAKDYKKICHTGQLSKERSAFFNKYQSYQ